MLRVCPRETKLIAALKGVSAQFPQIKILTDKVLGTGDILIHAIDTNEDQIFAVVERKTQGDMLASLKDTRYKTQTDRMKAMVNAGECHVAGYLIEGVSVTTGLDKRIEDVRDSVQYKHRLLFLQTPNVEASAQLLLRIAKKSMTYGQQIASAPKTSGLLGGSPTGKFAKKGDLRVRHFFEHQLMLVPGVSAAIAESVINNYPSLNELFAAWNGEIETSKKQNLLSCIICNEKTKRRIGPKVSGRIYNLFCANELAKMHI